MHEWNGDLKEFKDKFDKIFTPDVTARVYFVMACACFYALFVTGESGFIVALFGWLAATFAARTVGNYECVMAKIYEELNADKQRD